MQSAPRPPAKSYASPILRQLGTIEDLTLGGSGSKAEGNGNAPKKQMS